MAEHWSVGLADRGILPCNPDEELSDWDQRSLSGHIAFLASVYQGSSGGAAQRVTASQLQWVTWVQSWPHSLSAWSLLHSQLTTMCEENNSISGVLVLVGACWSAQTRRTEGPVTMLYESSVHISIRSIWYNWYQVDSDKECIRRRSWCKFTGLWLAT